MKTYGRGECLWCEEGFEKLKPNQRFCPGGKHRTAFHNNEAKNGLPLTPALREWLASMATDQGVSINEMACWMLEKTHNASGKTMGDDAIFGRKKENEK